MNIIQDWNKKIALKIAKKEGINLNNIHWDIIFIIRSFYIKNKMIPNMKYLSQELSKKYKINGISGYIFYLFPKGPLKQATKIAGIPQNNRCI